MYYILALSLILRLVLINQSLWLDESIQALAFMGRMGPLMTYALADFQPPLYHLIGWLWTSLAGYSEVALRIPSLLAGLGTVYFVFKIGQYLGGHKLSLLAGALAATNPLLIYYSQEGRTYGLTAFFVTASLYYFFKLLSKEYNNHRLLTINYLLFTTLYLWTSYLTWFLHLTLFFYALYLKRRDLLLPLVTSALTLLFWLPSLLSSLSIGLSTVAHSPEWGRVVGGISAKAIALTWVKFNLGRISFDNSYLYAALVLLLLLLHSYIISKAKKIPRLLLISLLTLPLVATFSFLVPIYSYTRLLFLLPLYLILLAYSLNTLPRILTLSIVSVQLLSITYFWVTPRFHREDWRALVADYGRDSTYALPSLAQNAPLLYYGVAGGQIIEPKTLPPLAPSRIIYIKYVEDVFDPSLSGPQHLNKSGYVITGQRVYPGMQVYIYEK